MSVPALSATRASESVLTLFKRHFGHTPPHVVKAPARLELLGHHTGYNEGVVMSVTVDRGTFIACAPRSDGKIELVTTAGPEAEKFWLTELKPNPAARWADAVKGVLSQLRKRGVHFNGFNAAIHTEIPADAGMNPAASLEVAMALAVRQLYPFSLGDSGATLPPRRDERGRIPPLAAGERMHFAKVCAAAAAESGRARSEAPEHIPLLFGKAWHALAVDCRFNTVDHLPLIGEAIVVCESGVKPESGAAQQAELRRLCTAAARKLGARALRSVEMKHLQSARAQLDLREYACAYHVVGEIARVVAGERSLREDDHRQFGQFMFQSHESARDFLRDSTTELDLLVDLARTHRGCLGARLTGDGFGGATINLVAHHEAQNFIAHMAAGYERATGLKLTPLICQIVDGAA